MRCLERSMTMLRKEGWVCAKAEHWNAFARIRQDLFGFIDVVALSSGNCQIVGVQVVNTNIGAHIDKIKENKAAKAWLACGGAIHVHNWRKRKAGWFVEIIEVTA